MKTLMFIKQLHIVANCVYHVHCAAASSRRSTEREREGEVGIENGGTAVYQMHGRKERVPAGT